MLRGLFSRKKEQLIQILRRIHSLVYNRFFGKTICCIGDSHIEVFEHVRRNGAWQNTRFELCVVPGASAQGVVNPNSKTHALQIYRNHLKIIPKTSHILFCLGEVDCGYVIWYRAKKYGISVDEQFRKSLTNYTSFINEVFLQGYCSIFVLSTPLPTIQDNQDWGDIAKLRAEQLSRMEVEASLKERTSLTVSYNAELRLFCEKKGFSFLDIESQMLDTEACKIRDEFLNPNPLDHHYDYEKTSELLIQRIKSMGFC